MRWKLRGWRIDRLGKLRQNRRRVHAIGKVTHEILHFPLPMPVKAKIVHFVQRLRGRPVLERHTVRCDEHSRAVFAILAMHENLLLRMIAENRKERDHLIVGGRGKSPNGNGHETQTLCFHGLALGFRRTVALAA